MFLGTSSKFSDLAHSARQSTVIDPNTDGQTTQLQSTCILSHIWPSAGVGGYSPCLTPLHPCQDYPGATMASGSSLPTLESRLSRGRGEAPWVWEDDLVHAESGLALECRIGKCREPHTIVGKNGCFYYAFSARGTQAQGQLPRHSQLSCLEQRPPFCFCGVSLC